jgi:hypothetical protein
MLNSDPDRLEKLLRDRRAGLVADEGFTEQVLARLPSRRAGSGRWAIPLFSALGLALAAPTLAGPLALLVESLLRPEGLLALAGVGAILGSTVSAWALLSDRARLR